MEPSILPLPSGTHAPHVPCLAPHRKRYSKAKATQPSAPGGADKADSRAATEEAVAAVAAAASRQNQDVAQVQAQVQEAQARLRDVEAAAAQAKRDKERVQAELEDLVR